MAFSPKKLTHRAIAEELTVSIGLKPKTGACTGVCHTWVECYFSDLEDALFDAAEYLGELKSATVGSVPIDEEIEDLKSATAGIISIDEKNAESFSFSESSPDLKNESFITDFEEAIKNVKEKKAATKQETRVFNSYAFLQEADIFHRPQDYKELLGRQIEQHDIADISQALTSQKLQRLGGIAVAYSDTFIFTKDEAQDYFEQLRNIIIDITRVKEEEKKMLPGQNKIAMRISSGTHTYGMRFDNKTGTWLIVDANNMPKLRSKPENLVNDLMRLFKKTDLTGCHIALYTPGNNLPNVQHKFDQFKAATRKQFITKEMLKRTDKTRLGPMKLLKLALKSRNTDLYSYLIDTFKLDINKIRIDGNPVLIYAVAQGSVKLIKELIAMGAEPNTKEEIGGWAALHLAAQNGKIDHIQFLVAGKAYVNQRDKEGNTPAHIAALHNRTDFLKALSLYKVNFNIPNNKKETPITIAINNKNWLAAALMLQHVDSLSLSNADQVIVNQYQKELNSALIGGTSRSIEPASRVGEPADVKSFRGSRPTPTGGNSGE